jgi:nicotinate-nucleotide adenylyltransferase
MVMGKLDISMAVAIFGGTFDPVHLGHIKVAGDLAEHLGVTPIALMPCGKPTHRLPPVATPLQRLDMLELSISGNPNLTIDNTEICSTTPNFTINSLDRIRSRIGSEAAIFLCIGSDTLNHIDSWYKWTELTNYCHIVAVSRPGSPKKYSPQLTEWISGHGSIDLRKLKESPAGCVYQCELSMLNISSTKIRQKIKQNETLQQLLPKKVVNYIQTNHLYK